MANVTEFSDANFQGDVLQSSVPCLSIFGLPGADRAG